MCRYRKMLLAFDGSESSRNALKQAIVLARSEQSWIRVVSVLPSYEGDLHLQGVSGIEEVLRNPADKLVKAAEEITSCEPVNVIINAEHGEPYEKIIDVAEEENCDLIVMGRRGLGRVERMLMGSVIYRVISHSNIDVLVFPEDAPLGWKNILIATDGSAYSDIALSKALNFARLYEGGCAAVSVANIYPESYAVAPKIVEQLERKAIDILRGTAEKARAAGIELETYHLRGEPHEEIVNLAREVNADIIFMGSHGRAGIKKFLMGSVTEKVIGLSYCPVLVAKSKQTY
ncbi:MAG: universal stress protein [Pseudomonadota bacterium]